MRPAPPGRPSSYSGRQKPRQTAARELRSTHPSDQGVQAAQPAAKTISDVIHLLWLSRWREDVFLPVHPLSARVFSLHPQACSAIRAWTHPLSCSPPARRTGSPLAPSIPPASWRPSLPAAVPATRVSWSGILLRV